MALQTQTRWAGAVEGSVGFAHDNDFRVRETTVNGQDPAAYAYDADGLLVQAGALALARDPKNGLLAGAALGGVSETYAHDGYGGLAAHTAKYNGAALYSLSLAHDALGRVVHKDEAVQGQADAYDYAYDAAGRLAGVRKNGAALASYAYDANGNRADGGGRADAQDRLTAAGGAAYAYDAAGGLQSKTEGGRATAYRYDVLGNLRRVDLPGGARIDYLVDGQNRRIGKKVDGVLVQGLLWRDGLRAAAELDGQNRVVSRFVHATRPNAPDYMARGGRTYRIITDPLGSVRLVVDAATGAVAQRLDYDPWGRVLLDTNPGFQPFGFAGGLYDRDTGLVRLGARDYDPAAGRWTAKDPILFGGGDTNLYGYVMGDPLNGIDPLGLSCFSCHSDLLDWYNPDVAPYYTKPPDNAYDPNGPKAPGKPGEAEGFRDPKGGENWVPNPNPRNGGSSHGWEQGNRMKELLDFA